MINEKERQNREELFRLMRENSDLPVLPMVDYEIVADDGYERWMGAWGGSYIGEYLIGRERVYFRDDGDLEEVIALLEERLGSEAAEAMSDEEAVGAYAGFPWVKAIIVNIDLP